MDDPAQKTAGAVVWISIVDDTQIVWRHQQQVILSGGASTSLADPLSSSS